MNSQHENTNSKGNFVNIFIIYKMNLSQNYTSKSKKIKHEFLNTFRNERQQKFIQKKYVLIIFLIRYL